MKRFVIPELDYTLTEGSVRIKDMKDLDTTIRKSIATHLNIPNIPISYAHPHWTDGGLSIQPLEERSKVLKIKAFISMMNSKNMNTRLKFRNLLDEERIHRNININENSNFINWELDQNNNFKTKKHGTSILAIKAKESADSNF